VKTQIVGYFVLFLSLLCAVISVLAWISQARARRWYSYLIRIVVSVAAVLASWALTDIGMSLLESKK